MTVVLHSLAAFNVPAETLERAWTTGAWPFDLGDERAPKWWRFGVGIVGVPTDEAEVASVLRLGPRTLLTVVELARVLAGSTDAAVAFRTVRHGVLRRIIDTSERDSWTAAVKRGEDHRGAVLRIAFAIERAAQWRGEPAWRESLVYRIREVDAAWPVLCALGATPVNLLACENNAVVLAVEEVER